MREVLGLTHTQADRIAGRAARAYARRCWWADVDALRHTAWCSMLIAAESGNYDARRPAEPYLSMAAFRGVQREIYRTCSPVSGSDKRCLGLTKIPVEAILSTPAPADDPETEACYRDWRDRTREAVLAEVGEDLHAAAGLAVILSGKKPDTVARTHGLDRKTVYRTVDRMKRKLAKSRRLMRLAQEMG